MTSSAFRMSLSSNLNPDIFQLVHPVEKDGKDLTIDQIIGALNVEERRANYEEEKLDPVALAAKKPGGGVGRGKTQI